MSKKRLAIGLATGGLAACLSGCGLIGDDAEETESQQRDKVGHVVVPVPLEIEAQRAKMERSYRQNLQLRTEALQGECKTKLDAQKCVEGYTAAHFEAEPSTEAAEKKPETDPENSSSGEDEVDQDEAPEVEPTEPAEPATPGATNEPEPDTTASDRTKKPIGPISPEILFTAKQKGSYRLEDGTFLEGTFEGQGAEGTFVGSITKPNGVVLRARANYTEQSKGGWTGWMRAPDFVVRPNGAAVATYSDGRTLSFSFTTDSTGNVDYSSPATSTLEGVSVKLEPNAGSSFEGWLRWGRGEDPSVSCEPFHILVTLDKGTLALKEEVWDDVATTRTDCLPQQ